MTNLDNIINSVKQLVKCGICQISKYMNYQKSQSQFHTYLRTPSKIYCCILNENTFIKCNNKNMKYEYELITKQVEKNLNTVSKF